MKRKNKFSPITVGLCKLLGNQKQQKIRVPLFSIVLSLLVGSIVILLLGKNPISAYIGFLQGSGFLSKANYAGGANQFTEFMGFLDLLAPLIFAALAVTIALKAGLFNIGVAGQMLISAFIATITIGYFPLNSWISKPLVLLIGLTVGALSGGLVGYLKARFNINEVVSTIMFNYIIQYFSSFLIHKYYIDPVTRQSRYILQSASLTLKKVNFLGHKMDISLGFFIAIVAAILINLLVNKTKWGFEIKMVGSNKKGAEYSGVNVSRTIVTTMMISGALAGLAGVCFYMGYFQSIQPRTLSSIGFDAIATSLLGGVNAIGVIFSSVLITILDKGVAYMSSKLGIVREISGVITSIILIFSAVSSYIIYKVSLIYDKINMKDEVEING